MLKFCYLVFIQISMINQFIFIYNSYIIIVKVENVSQGLSVIKNVNSTTKKYPRKHEKYPGRISCGLNG